MARGRVYVPDLFFVEFGNVLWKMHRFGNIPMDEITAATKEIEFLYNDIVKSKSLWIDATFTALDTKLSVYDAV